MPTLIGGADDTALRDVEGDEALRRTEEGDRLVSSEGEEAVKAEEGEARRDTARRRSTSDSGEEER